MGRNVGAARPSVKVMVAHTLVRSSLSYSDLPAARSGGASEVDSDAALVDRARRGDYSAFEMLFERHRGLVYRYAYQMSGRRDDAEDMVQDVFVRAYENLHRYRDEAKFTTWLLRITTNRGTDQARMGQRRQALEQQEAAGALTWMTTGTSVEDPVENLDTERRVALLREAIGSLPDHHRNAIIFRDLQGLEYQEIADYFKCSIGGAKLRVLRARRALRDKLAPTLGAEYSARAEDEMTNQAEVL